MATNALSGPAFLFRRGAVTITRRALTTFILATSLASAGCVTHSPDSSLASPSPMFDVERFFAGHSEGEGELVVLMSPKRKVDVRSFGRFQPDGTLVLDQIVKRAGNRATSRQWRLTKVAEGRYTGSLTDARGPVSGVVRGNSLRLSYTMKGNGLQVEQWIYVAADGRSASNRMTIRKYGIIVASLNETIRKTD